MINDTSENPIILTYEPYSNQDYLHGDYHIIMAWGEGHGLWLRREHRPLPSPILHPDPFSMAETETTLSLYEKPTCFLQISHTPEHNEKYPRNLPPEIMQEVIDSCPDIQFMQWVQPGEQILSNVIALQDLSLSMLISTIAKSDMVLTIDSVTQHIAMAMKKKAIVCWGSTRPQCMGYEYHDNLIRYVCPTPLCNRPNHLLNDTKIDGTAWTCPYGEVCLQHSPAEILKAIRRY